MTVSGPSILKTRVCKKGSPKQRASCLATATYCVAIPCCSQSSGDNSKYPCSREYEKRISAFAGFESRKESSDTVVAVDVGLRITKLSIAVVLRLSEDASSSSNKIK